MVLKARFQQFVFLSVIASTTAQSGLAPKTYLNLNLGEIRASGWLQDQINVQNNGQAGHQHEFYKLVSESDWIGGTSFYSDLEEAGSYWFNAAVPAAVLANNTAIQSKVNSFLDFVLSHQDSSGWLGPEVLVTSKPRHLWGRYPFLFGAIQMIENNPSLASRVVPAMHKFVALANSMLQKGQGTEAWTNTRWEDFVIALQWLYDFYPNGKEDLLIDTMKRIKWAGVPWEKVFSTQYFPTTAVDNTPNPFGLSLTWHGVNLAEGLKALPATYRFTRNQTDLDRISEGWDLLFKYHGRPSGIFAADEYLAGLEAIRGTELCLVVETMFSGSYIYQVTGNPKYINRVERITYNALPGTLTGDMWTRQYLQQQNQIAAKNMSPNPFPHDGAYSNVFGLEPNYPCCTVNHPQGWPKFVTNSFVKSADSTKLVQAYLGPFSVRTTLSNSNPVTVVVDTLYPFSDTLTTTITASKAFTYYVRIPEWVNGGTIAINGGAATAVSPSNGLQAVNCAAGTTKFTLNLPAPITTESRPHGSIAVQRGPLHYAYDIPRTSKILRTDPNEHRAVDYEFDVASGATWQYAIDPSTLTFHNNPPSGGKLPSPIFDSGKSPLTITVKACKVNWSVAGDTFAASPPQSPASCTGATTTITLAPYGTTKLRIGEFPTFKSA